MNETKRIDYIQALRGIACISVILYHGSFFINTNKDALGDRLFGSLGSFGVSLFFIISGFIMTYTTRNFDGSISYAKDFIIKRILRVWPVYAIATIISAFSLSGIPDMSNYNDIIIFVKSMFFIPSGNGSAPVFGFPTLVVGWTLNYEMFFYIIFGLSLLAGKLRWFAFYSSIILLLILIPIMSYGFYTLDPSKSYGFSSPVIMIATSPIIWFFISGVAIGSIYCGKLKIKSKVMCWHLILIAVSIVFSQLFSGKRIGNGIGDWGITLIPMMLLMSIASKSINIKIPYPLIYLGNISYSMYLFHPLAQGLTTHFLVMARFGDFSYGIQGLIISTVTAICIGSISYYSIEKSISLIIKKITSH